MLREPRRGRPARLPDDPSEGPLRTVPLLLVAACAGRLTPDELVTSLTEPGPWAVGYRETGLTYTEPGGSERSLRLALWYPTDAAFGVEVRYQGLFPAPGVWDAPDPSDGDLPLAVYSHGHRGFAEASGRLMAHLASHGWLVAAPDHTGNTTFDDPERRTAIYYQRATDVSAVIDLLDTGDDPLSGRSTGEVLAVGHSFGGYTVLGLGGARFAMDDLEAECDAGTGPAGFCSDLGEDERAVFRAGVTDPRIDAVAAMAPGDWDKYRDGLAEVAVPTLHLTGDLDPNGGDADAIWQGLPNARDLRVQLPQGGHQTWTDVSGTLDPEGTIEPERGWRIARAYLLAFARRHVLDDTEVDPVLTGEVPIDADAVHLVTR